ncbi:hypothetical protein [Streptomyces sp. G45]|uniref:hypothetical protein n=1 Tax=Streptomyces sp. G45 TaxID=3406627 RepID=UPI003C1AEB0F
MLFEPGPVNEELADTVARIRRQRDLPVYAQWEIARFLDSKYAMKNVTSIEPVIASDGTITYLSTDGVAQQVAEARRKLPGGLGTACVVGFRDHLKRCVLTTKDRGMPAFAPRGFTMPKTYDPQQARGLCHISFVQVSGLSVRYSHGRSRVYGAGMAETRAPRLRLVALVDVGEGPRSCCGCGEPLMPGAKATAVFCSSEGRWRSWGEGRRVRARAEAVQAGRRARCPQCGRVGTVGVERPALAPYCSPGCRKRAWHQRRSGQAGR